MSQPKAQLRRDGFTFKSFFVAHDRCAMKVGTDGVMLGAWAPVSRARHILDIGSGSGLLALMLAQRTANDVTLDAVELDEQAAGQAQENVQASMWPIAFASIAPIFSPGASRTPRVLISSSVIRPTLKRALSAPRLSATARATPPPSITRRCWRSPRRLSPKRGFSVWYCRLKPVKALVRKRDSSAGICVFVPMSRRQKAPAAPRAAGLLAATGRAVCRQAGDPRRGSALFRKL